MTFLMDPFRPPWPLSLRNYTNNLSDLAGVAGGISGEASAVVFWRPSCVKIEIFPRCFARGGSAVRKVTWAQESRKLHTLVQSTNQKDLWSVAVSSLKVQ